MSDVTPEDLLTASRMVTKDHLAQAILRGECNDLPAIQEIARHRIASTASLIKERDALRERVAVLEEALKPFAKAFLDQRESYIRRYPNHPMIGATNFDAMPDEWEMEQMTFSMGEFRRAIDAISATKDNNHE